MLKDSEKNLPKPIVDEMLDYVYSHGMVVKAKEGKGVTQIPIVLYPSPIPKSLFDKITFYQIAFNKIIDKLSRDQAYLEEILTPLAESDEFIKKNLEISKKAAAFEHKQLVQLGIFRNDFMVDKTKKFIYQIEYNTIAVTMGFFSDSLQNFFNYFSKKYPEVYAKYHGKEKIKVPTEKPNTIETFANSMIDAIKLTCKDEYKNTIIVFIVQNGEKNLFDQRSIENELWDKHEVKSVRLTLNEVAQKCTTAENGDISYEGKKISLFYFRACYTEKDYIDEESWKGREMIELSTAIKCPNINTFLTTFKVFQYELTKPDVLKKYLTDELIINDISRFFVKLYYIRDMNKDQQKELFTNVTANLDKFVLKPQKEGGGNNIYGDTILTLIPNADVEPGNELLSTLVMEKIEPPEYETLILKDDEIKTATCVSEFSAYGVVLSDDKSLIENKSVNYLVRTKDHQSSEGGVIVGVSAIDLPCLIDMPINKEDTNPLTYSFE